MYYSPVSRFLVENSVIKNFIENFLSTSSRKCKLGLCFPTSHILSVFILLSLQIVPFCSTCLASKAPSGSSILISRFNIAAYTAQDFSGFCSGVCVHGWFCYTNMCILRLYGENEFLE